MNIGTVKQQIKDKQPKHFYVFTGDEVAVMDIYINKIAECIGVKPTRADSVIDIMGKITGNSFINSCGCYVIREDTDFLKQEKVWQDFVDEKIQNNNIVILCYNSLDKRSKFYKQYKSILTEFERLNEQILSKYIAQKIDLSTHNTYTLMELCEYDLSRIYLEIDKIISYSKYARVDCNKAFEILLVSGVIFEPPYDAIFDFINAILKRDKKLAYNLYQQCKDIGEPTIRLLTVLHNVAKQVLQVQSCESADISKSTGLTPYQVKCAKALVGHYKNRELINIMKVVRKVEKGIKTGEIEDSIAMDYVLVNVL